METILSKYVAKYSLLLLVLFSATANASMQAQVARANKTPYKIVDFVLSVFVSAFSAVLFWYLGKAAELPEYQLISVTLIGGVLGSRGINYVVERFFQMMPHGKS